VEGLQPMCKVDGGGPGSAVRNFTGQKTFLTAQPLFKVKDCWKAHSLFENNEKSGISPKQILNVASVRNYAGTRLLVSCACTTNW
jgi:hypothetical protein